MTIQDEVWTTRDGREIAVGDMDESHLRSTLRIILRNARKRKEKFLQDVQNDYMEACHHGWGDR